MLALRLNGGGVCKLALRGAAAAACKMIRLINHVAHTDAGNTTLGIEKEKNMAEYYFYDGRLGVGPSVNSDLFTSRGDCWVR